MSKLFSLHFCPQSPCDVISLLINSRADELRDNPSQPHPYIAQEILELTVRALHYWVDSIFKPADAGGGIVASEAAACVIAQANALRTQMNTAHIPKSYERFVTDMAGLFCYLTRPVEFLNTQAKKDTYAAQLREAIADLEGRV